MIAAELPGATWRKSSHSGTNANCVEVADVPAGLAVRDSKDPGGPVLLFPEATWRAFVTGITTEQFNG